MAWFPAGLAAIILGHRARRQIRETGEQGDGMALAGLVLGYIGIGFTLLLVVVIVLLGVAVTQHPDQVRRIGRSRQGRARGTAADGPASFPA